MGVLFYVSMVVCCNTAGIGRTGVFVAVKVLFDYLSQAAPADDHSVDATMTESAAIPCVFSVVASIRTARLHAVQTLSQHNFIWECVEQLLSPDESSSHNMMHSAKSRIDMINQAAATFHTADSDDQLKSQPPHRDGRHPQSVTVTARRVDGFPVVGSGLSGRESDSQTPIPPA